MKVKLVDISGGWGTQEKLDTAIQEIEKENIIDSMSMNAKYVLFAYKPKNPLAEYNKNRAINKSKAVKSKVEPVKEAKTESKDEPKGIFIR